MRNTAPAVLIFASLALAACRKAPNFDDQLLWAERRVLGEHGAPMRPERTLVDVGGVLVRADGSRDTLRVYSAYGIEGRGLCYTPGDIPWGTEFAAVELWAAEPLPVDSAHWRSIRLLK